MRKIPLKKFFFCLLISMLWSSLFVCSAAFAAENQAASQEEIQLETITVTAEKRKEDVQTIPSRVTVLGETRIDDFEINNTLDLASFTPNLYFLDVGDPMLSMVSMRGLFKSYDLGLPVGFYVDDVPYWGLNINLYDIEKVEVLRGPQGTLYGRNSEAGVVNIITQKPSSSWEGNLALTGGSFHSYGLQGVISGPILEDRMGFKAAVSYHESDGYFENQYDNSDDGGREEDLDGRFTVTALPSDKLNLTLTADFQNYKSPKYAEFAPLDSKNLRKAVNVDYAGEASKDAGGASLRGEYQFDRLFLNKKT